MILDLKQGKRFGSVSMVFLKEDTAILLANFDSNNQCKFRV